MDSLGSSGLTSPGDITVNAHRQFVPSFDTTSKALDLQKESSQDYQQQEQQPTPKYTTVGSVYNPQSSQPLQPPARRGRTVKWPPTTHPELPHIGFTRSALSALAFRTATSHGPETPPMNLDSFHQYSPLRQNFDRAISPVPTSPTTFDLTGHDGDILSPPHTALPNMLGRGSPGMGTMVDTNKLNDTDTHGNLSEDEDDNDDLVKKEVSLNRMSIKSLHNLASYLNPMQKHAQKIISQAQPQHLPAASNLHSQERQSSPYQKPADPTGEQGRLLLGNYRHSRSDPVAISNLLQSDRGAESGGLNRPLRFPPGLAASPRGPGVPQPLTAGPPGQRQYRASALDLAKNATLNNFQRTRELDEQTLIPNPYNSQTQSRQYLSPQNRNSSPSYESERISAIRDMLPQGRGKESMDSRAADSPSGEDAHEWYFEDLTNLSQDTAMGSQDWTRDYPLDCTHERRRTEHLAEHMASTLDHFYSGTSMFNKTLAEVIEEKDRRTFHRTFGVIGGERKKAKSNPKITVEDARKMATHEHIEPLLSMALQTFVRYSDSTAPNTS